MGTPSEPIVSESDPGITRRAFVRLSLATAGSAGIGGALGLLGGCGESGGTTGLGTRFEYDLRQLARTDPALLGYTRERVIGAGINGARSMALDRARRLWIAVGEPGVPAELSGAESIGVEAIRTIAGATAVACDEDELFVSTADTVSVRRDGSERHRWKLDGRPYITCLAVSGESVFVADAGNRVVWRFDRAGDRINTIGQRPDDPTGGVDESDTGRGFIVPSPLFDCAVDPSGGLLWVANTGRHRMEAYRFDGRPEGHWGRASMDIRGFCGCCNPCHFAVLPDGRFVTGEKGLPRVKRYGTAGEFECVVAGCEQYGLEGDALTCNTPASRLGGPLVAVDGNDRVLTLHPATGELAVFRPADAERHLGATGT